MQVVLPGPPPKPLPVLPGGHELDKQSFGEEEQGMAAPRWTDEPVFEQGYLGALQTARIAPLWCLPSHPVMVLPPAVSSFAVHSQITLS